MNRAITFFCLLTSVFYSSFCAASDWAQWRGPEQNGLSRERHLPEKWSPDGENLLWTQPVGGMSSPIVMNGKLFTITRVGEDAAPDTLIPGPRTQESIVCLDAETGKPLWEYRENITQSEVPFHRLGWSNPVGDPKTNRVYALGVQCSLLCLDGDSGKVIWKRQLTEEFGMISTFGGRTPSPALDEDQIIVGGVAFGWGDHARAQHRVFAFNKSTGELNWSNGTGGTPVDAPYNTPIVSTIDGVRLVMLGAGDGGVHAFKVRTGEKVWSFKASKRGLNASVLVDGTRVYICHSEENLDNSAMGSVICIDVADHKPKIVWRDDGIEAGFGSPTINGNNLYVVDNKGAIFGLDATDGKQYWKQNGGTIGKASLVFADDKLYMAEANGRFSILKPGPKKCVVLSRVDLDEKLGREYAIFGSPAIANGRIYLQCANRMYCIGPKVATPGNDPVPMMALEPAIDAKNPPAASWIQVRPADLLLRPGQKATLTAWAFDAKGRPLGQVKADKWAIGQLAIPAAPTATPGTPPTPVGNLKGDLDADGAFTAASGPHQGGAIVATAGGVAGFARVRVLPPLPWKFDFEQNPLDKPPLTWLGAGGKFAVHDDKGNKVLVKLTDFDLYYRARTNFGAVDMSNYTLQADVKVGEKNLGGERQMPDPGIINSRYVLVLLGNHQRVQIHIWPTTLPYSLNKTIPYKWEPNKWYTMKLRVEQAADKAIVRGKVWPIDQKEPDAWTVELEDTLPNRNGNPGLFGHSLVGAAKSEISYDNILVSDNK
jgi:outer membrane protein assembly factor BamB